MSVLTDRVSSDLKLAMKERREPDLSVFRMLKAELQKLQADQGLSYQITDDDVLTLVRRLVKQRKEAAEQYTAGGAADRAAAELSECKVLEAYLPAQLAPEQVEEKVRAIAAQIGASTPKDMGKLMGAVMAQLKGQADGKLVRETVQRILKGH